MEALIRNIAEYLIESWNSMSGWLKDAIESLLSAGLADAIQNGVHALVDYLGDFSQWVLESIAWLLGL